MRILFVCLGNICRSPSAEAVMQQLIESKNLTQQIELDSAGTIAIHTGEKADRRMRKAASKRGINLTSLSRKITTGDFDNSDYIVVMDESNYEDVLSITPSTYTANILKMMDFSTSYNYSGVPDPYYGSEKGFEEVLDILEESCENLLHFINVKMDEQ